MVENIGTKSSHMSRLRDARTGISGVWQWTRRCVCVWCRSSHVSTECGQETHVGVSSSCSCLSQLALWKHPYILNTLSLTFPWHHQMFPRISSPHTSLSFVPLPHSHLLFFLQMFIFHSFFVDLLHNFCRSKHFSDVRGTFSWEETQQQNECFLRGGAWWPRNVGITHWIWGEEEGWWRTWGKNKRAWKIRGR